MSANDAQSHSPLPPDSPLIERPVKSAADAYFGSDLVAETLRAIGVPYIALNPGASFRGLHDSLVNHLGNERPQILLCLHEEHAVAIAHGYAKVTGKLMAAAVHSNVGLMHGTMAIFNAWCDRMPVLVLGATGPVDAAKRRPWIDWIHTARDQGSLVRSYVKWDDQPASPAAAQEALLRAAWIAGTGPKGPVYVNLDAEMQEARLDVPLQVKATRFLPRVSQSPGVQLARAVTDVISRATRPVLLVGRVSRSTEAWAARVALAERIGARVGTDLKVAAGFPTDHPLHVGAPGLFPGAPLLEELQRADVVVSLDWVDLAGTLAQAFPGGVPETTTVVQISLDQNLHNGWSMDHQAHPAVDLFVAADPDEAVEAVLSGLGAAAATNRERPGSSPSRRADSSSPVITVELLGTTLRSVLHDREASLLHLPLSWNAEVWPFRHPLDYLGSDGGGGIGSGPGISVGAALALRGTGRLPIAVLGDGDFLMGVTALWTAAHYRVPLLLVVANNQSFYNDEIHQERVARMRGRPVENKWIGQRMIDPELDLLGMAQAQGASIFGPVKSAADLADTLTAAVAALDAGRIVVVDVRVAPGYTPSTVAALTRSGEPKK